MKSNNNKNENVPKGYGERNKNNEKKGTRKKKKESRTQPKMILFSVTRIMVKTGVIKRYNSAGEKCWEERKTKLKIGRGEEARVRMNSFKVNREMMPARKLLALLLRLVTVLVLVLVGLRRGTPEERNKYWRRSEGMREKAGEGKNKKEQQSAFECWRCFSELTFGKGKAESEAGRSDVSNVGRWRSF